MDGVSLPSAFGSGSQSSALSEKCLEKDWGRRRECGERGGVRWGGGEYLEGGQSDSCR